MVCDVLLSGIRGLGVVVVDLHLYYRVHLERGLNTGAMSNTHKDDE
jgi:hypothetical protein